MENGAPRQGGAFGVGPLATRGKNVIPDIPLFEPREAKRSCAFMIHSAGKYVDYRQCCGDAAWVPRPEERVGEWGRGGPRRSQPVVVVWSTATCPSSEAYYTLHVAI
jgi:hypothetical protein